MGVTLIQNRFGAVRQWKEVRKDKEYVIGADVAEGKAVTDDPHAGSEGRDYSAAVVLEMRSGELVAGYHDQLPSNEFAVDLDYLGRYYNDALLAPESNTYGASVIQNLRNADYPNLYLPPEVSSHSHVGLRLGWVTSRSTRPRIIDAIREALAARFEIPWKELLDELEAMEMDPKTGRAQAPYGAHDDIAMAYGIALCVREEYLYEGNPNLDLPRHLNEDDAKIWRAFQREAEHWQRRRDDE